VRLIPIKLPTRSSTLATFEEHNTIPKTASPARGVVVLIEYQRICGAASGGSMSIVGVATGEGVGDGVVVGDIGGEGDVHGEGVAGGKGVGLGDPVGVAVALGSDCERTGGGAPAAKTARVHAAANTPSVKGLESPPYRINDTFAKSAPFPLVDALADLSLA
jgi:hypothetical protein